jgi:hypothetical protein
MRNRKSRTNTKSESLQAEITIVNRMKEIIRGLTKQKGTYANVQIRLHGGRSEAGELIIMQPEFRVDNPNTIGYGGTLDSAVENMSKQVQRFERIQQLQAEIEALQKESR